jgi:short-subunit dehydrogenase
MPFGGPDSDTTERLIGVHVTGGCKAYIVAFSQLLCQELAGSGVEVQVCCPGVVETDFHKVVGIDLSVRPLRPSSPTRW